MKEFPYMTVADRDPDETRRAVLRVLATANRSMRRRAIQQEVFGDRWGAGHVATALRWLREHRLVERSVRDDRAYWITPAGRTALELRDAMDEAS